MDATTKVTSSLFTRELKRRTFLRGAIGLGALSTLGTSLLAACSQAPAVTQPKREDATVLFSGGTAPVTSMDPTVSSLRFTIQHHVFDAIVGVNAETMQYDNSGLAESWQALGPTTWQFKLRSGVKYHNGDTLHAEDVKTTIERILDPETKNGQRGSYTFIKEVNVVDPITFNIETDGPVGGLIGLMSVVLPVPTAHYKNVGSEAFDKAPVGTGAYKIPRFNKGEFYELERFEDYWGNKPALKKVTFRYVTEAGTKIAGLRSGEADLIDLVPPSEATAMESDPNLVVSTASSNRSLFVGMNTFKPPFDDIRVRHAMNYAINWDEIINNVAHGEKRLATIVASGTEGYDASVEPYPYDPDRARSLLAEAGYQNGFETTFDTPAGWFSQDKEVSQAVAAQLEQFGIKVSMFSAVQATFWDKYVNKRSDGYYFLGCGNVIGTFELCTRLHYHTKYRGIYYNSPQMDQLLDQVASATDVNERKRLASQTQQLIRDEAPMIFGYEDRQIFAMKRGLRWQGYPHERVDMKIASWE